MEENNKDEVKNEQNTTPETQNVSEMAEEIKSNPIEDAISEQQNSTQKVDEVKQTNQQDDKSNENTPKKKKKNIKLIISIVLIVLAIIAGIVGAIVYCLVFTKTEIDLSKYISIEFEGYEGFVEVDESDINIDAKALKKAVDDSAISKKLLSKIEDTIEVEDNEELKNGDEVTVKVKLKESFLKENKLTLKSDTIKIKVEGLEETESVNLFEDLDFEFSGVSPNLTLSIKNNSTDNFIKTVTYTMETEDGNSSYYNTLYELANGDKITLTASYKDSDLETSGYFVEKDTYEYTIEGQPEYIDSSDKMTKEVLDSLKTKFESEVKKSANSRSFSAVSAIKDNIDYSDNFTASDPTFVSCYLLSEKNSSSYSSSRNKVYAIYKVTFTSTVNSATYDYYYTVYTSNVAYDSEGLYTGLSYYYSVSSEYGSSSYAQSAEDAYDYFIDSQKSSFDISEIKL